MKKTVTILVFLFIGLFAFKSYAQTPNLDNKIMVFVTPDSTITINNLITGQDSVFVWIVSETDTLRLMITDSLMQPITFSTTNDRILIYGDITELKLNDNANVLGLDIQFNKKIQRITTNRNAMQHINIGLLENLEYLTAKDNLIDNAIINECPRLKEVLLNGNQLENINTLYPLDSLEMLNLNSNLLIDIDAHNFPRLQKLYCQNNELSACELDYLFTTLSDRRPFYIVDSGFVMIGSNPGINECRTFLARDKNWEVIDEMTINGHEIVNTNFTCNVNSTNKITLNVIPQKEISFIVKNYTENTPVYLINGQDTIFTFAKYLERGNGITAKNMIFINPRQITFTTQSTTFELYGDVNVFMLSQNDSVIKNIELNNNTEIERFIACGSSDLTSVDVNNCQKIYEIIVAGNPTLSSININSCPSLITLLCYSSALETLAIKEANNLRGIDCSGNNLSSCALDSIFHMITPRNGENQGVIFIQDDQLTNPGNFSCRDTIATNKNWRVWDFKTQEDIVNTTYDCPYFTVGLNKNPSQIDISLYPNPVKDELVIECPKKIEDIAIYDIMGRRVNTQTTSSISTTKLDFSSFTQGVYIINIQTKDGKARYKIIKE